MARSQAANLSGLLSDIGGTLGKMGEPGQQYVDTYRRLQAPDLNTDDSNSIMNYAEWARRNGYDDEAKQYLALGYKQKEKEAQEAKDAALGKTMAEATQSSASGQQLGAMGDLGGADATIESLRKRLNNPDIQKNPLAVRAIQEEIRGLQASRPDFVAKNTQAIAQGVAKMDQNIAALNKDDPQYDIKKAKLLEARDRFLQQPNVAEAYEGNKLKMMELNNQQAEAMWKNQRSVITQEIANAGTDINQIKMIEEKYPQFAAEIQSIKGPMIQQAVDLEALRSDQFDISQIPSKIEEQRQLVKDSAMSETEKNTAYKLLDGVQTNYDKGKAAGTVQGSKTQLDSVMQNINGIINNANAAEAGVDRQREERAVVAHEKAMLTTVSAKDISDLAETRYGKNPNDDELAEVERELQNELADYQYRTAIASGREAPMSLDSDDKRQMQKDLTDGVYGKDHDIAIMRLTYKLVSEGFSEKDVVSFLKQELPNGQADRAVDIYNDMWTDLQNQDEQTLAPSQVTADPFRREPGFRWLDRASETINSRYEGFLQRRSQTLPARPPRGPSVTERQRDNLSPSLGPIDQSGGPTKLREARDNMRTGDGYPYPGAGITLKDGERDPYIYRTYR